jgi:hypothetical protein
MTNPLENNHLLLQINTYLLQLHRQKENSVKEVTVLYRGSTGLDKTLEKPGDVYRDWVVNNSEMAHKILASEQGNPPPQLVSSAETLKEAMELYPNANFSVYGH